MHQWIGSMAFFGFEQLTLNTMSQIKGLGMTDVLVSILLLGVTLGGAFSANNAGIKELRFLNKATVAMNATKEISIRMSSNINIGNQKIYEVDTSKVLYQLIDCSDGCSSHQIAQNDVYQWTSKILNAIPDARMKITMENNIANIGILWKASSKITSNKHLCPFSINQTKDKYCIAFESVAKLND